MNFTIVGLGYVGLSLSVLISQKHNVIAYDVNAKKVELINDKISPIKDTELEDFFQNTNLKLSATTDKLKAYNSSEYIIISTPTNFNTENKSFDTKSVDSSISDIININPKATIIIKSTIPIGYTNNLRNRFKKNDIIFSPEFLRETKALYDNLHPSRVIVGDNTPKAKKFAEVLVSCAKKDSNKIPIFFMSSIEAESVKLFANTYLAMRIAFFNELDTFSEFNNLNSESIISGVSSDERIGNYYNNPSFGYGGYCLPKDTQQLLDDYKHIPNSLINSVIESNVVRKKFIIESILKKNPKIVGIYRLIMKEGSDNFRESAIIDIIEGLKAEKIKIILYEPFLENNTYKNITVIKDLNDFISSSDIIVANRLSSDLKNVKSKVYSRDLFRVN